ncbi:MAG: tRNA-intron lyase [Candidatus Freyarchaeota archaeon]
MNSKERIEAELVENFLIVWDPTRGSELYKMGFYGKPLGIPKPKITEFDAPLILDLMEGLYLLEKGIIRVVECPEKTRVGFEELRRIAEKVYEDFDMKYAVYRDLRDHGLVVTPGIKYGCDFAVYKRGPGLEHAPYMVSVKKRGDEISATEIVKAGRLATTVRKRFIVAIPKPETETIQYLIFKWFKA